MKILILERVRLEHQTLKLSQRTKEDILAVLEADKQQARDRFATMTINEIKMYFDVEGTHSIIDVDRIGPGNNNDTFIDALSEEELLELLGTTTPTREDLLKAKSDFKLDQEAFWRWVEITQLFNYLSDCYGFYIIIYKDGQPDEIYIEGASGD